MRNEEHKLAVTIARYLQTRRDIEKDLDFRFDVGADVKLTMGQAKKLKRLNDKKGYPDATIFLKNGRTIFIELKKSKDEICKKNGEFRENNHLKEQLKRHEYLRDLGFEVYFVWKFEQIIKILS